MLLLSIFDFSFCTSIAYDCLQQIINLAKLLFVFDFYSCVRLKMRKSRRADNKMSYSKCFGVAFSKQILLFSYACIWILEFVAFTVVNVVLC